MDIDNRWQLHPQVALRPEPFGALLYHFGTRKLSFLKNSAIVDVVRSLPDHRDARSALVAAGVSDEAMPRYADALAALVRSQMLVSSPVTEGPA